MAVTDYEIQAAMQEIERLRGMGPIPRLPDGSQDVEAIRARGREIRLQECILTRAHAERHPVPEPVRTGRFWFQRPDGRWYWDANAAWHADRTRRGRR